MVVAGVLEIAVPVVEVEGVAAVGVVVVTVVVAVGADEEDAGETGFVPNCGTEGVPVKPESVKPVDGVVPVVAGFEVLVAPSCEVAEVEADVLAVVGADVLVAVVFSVVEDGLMLRVRAGAVETFETAAP